ncbi:MAG: hypothetical protein GY802_24430, partial [Gammaproteobacteria bacterium]|nr:hypothetical protein [Gammaproteobacteria bacterium]
IHIRESIEIDSLEAIENLVAKGFGASIVPRRLHATIDSENIMQIPFGNPADRRQLALVQHASRPRTSFDLALKKIFTGLPDRS